MNSMNQPLQPDLAAHLCVSMLDADHGVDAEGFVALTHGHGILALEIQFAK